MTTNDGRRGVHVRTANDPRKAFAQFEELARSRDLTGAVVIATRPGGRVEVLGQGTPLEDMADMILMAAQGVAHAIEKTSEGNGARRPTTTAQRHPDAPSGYAGEPGGLLNAEWRSYAEKVLPPGAPAVQRVECRRAFYGGAMSMFFAITDGLTAGDEITDADLARIEKLHDELKKFSDACGENRA